MTSESYKLFANGRVRLPPSGTLLVGNRLYTCFYVDLDAGHYVSGLIEPPTGTLSVIGRYLGYREWIYPEQEGQPFVEYGPEDEKWAIPLGFGRWSAERPLLPGMIVKLKTTNPDFEWSILIKRIYVTNELEPMFMFNIEFQLIHPLTGIEL